MKRGSSGNRVVWASGRAQGYLAQVEVGEASGEAEAGFQKAEGQQQGMSKCTGNHFLFFLLSLKLLSLGDLSALQAGRSRLCKGFPERH